MGRSSLFLGVVLVLTVWSVKSGQNAETSMSVSNGNISPSDYNRFKTVLTKAWALSDPLTVSYAVLAYSVMNLEVPKAKEVCSYLTSSMDALDGSKLEVIFASSAAITKVPGCKLAAMKPAVKQALEKKLTTEGSTSQDLFYVVSSLKNAGSALDANKVAETLKTAIKKDDSPSSIGYALWAASVVYKSGMKPDLWDRIEDLVAQADEVDKLYLQFEGGLSVTAAALNGIYRLSEISNKPLPLSADQVIKFGNYLVSRKTVTTPRGLWLLVNSLEIVSKNKFLNPVYVGFVETNVLTESNQVLKLEATDLMGRPVDVNVIMDSIADKTGRKSGDIQFLQGLASSDSKFHSFDLKSKKMPKGFYKGVFSVKSKKNDKTLVMQPKTLEFKVSGKLGAVSARVGIAESDQQAKTKWIDLNKGQKLSSKLDLEAAQRLIVKIAASDSLHQVFILLRCQKSKKEVAFVATPESEGKTDYKFELDLSLNAKDLAYKSGVYEIVVFLGDFLIEDPVEWTMGEVGLQLAAGKPKTVNELYSVTYGPKPEIKHTFRAPEPLPPRVLSDAFTLLVLSPFLILFGLWMKIGINFGNFPSGRALSALLFHGSLAAMLGVYALFWLKLNMFEALKWMSIPGCLTFFFGHRLLSYMAEKRKA